MYGLRCDQFYMRAPVRFITTASSTLPFPEDREKEKIVKAVCSWLGLGCCLSGPRAKLHKSPFPGIPDLHSTLISGP